MKELDDIFDASMMDSKVPKKKKKEKPTLNKHLFLPNSFVSTSFSLVFF
jgi:hypothetical protein